jgi:hypothetical protein
LAIGGVTNSAVDTIVPPMKDAKSIAELVEREILNISDAGIAQRIRELLVNPYPVDRFWDYGTPD